MTVSTVDIALPTDTTQLKRSGAAKDFEALLLTELLRAAHSGGSGWLDSGDDQSGQAAIGFGEEELAKALSSSGGIGLARLIEAGLRR
jgi:hypothetical protein